MNHSCPIFNAENAICASLSGDFVLQTSYRGFAPGPNWGTSVRRSPIMDLQLAKPAYASAPPFPDQNISCPSKLYQARGISFLRHSVVLNVSSRELVSATTETIGLLAYKSRKRFSTFTVLYADCVVNINGTSGKIYLQKFRMKKLII